MAEVWELVTIIIGTVTPLTGIIVWLHTQSQKSHDNRLGTMQKEIDQLRSNTTEMLTEINYNYEKLEELYRKYFHEIFTSLSEMKGRDSARRNKGAV